MADQHQRLLHNFAQKLESTRQVGLNDFSLKVDEEINKIGSDGIFTSDEVMMIAEEAKVAVEDVFQQIEKMYIFHVKLNGHLPTYNGFRFSIHEFDIKFNNILLITKFSALVRCGCASICTKPVWVLFWASTKNAFVVCAVAVEFRIRFWSDVRATNQCNEKIRMLRAEARGVSCLCTVSRRVQRVDCFSRGHVPTEHSPN
jgi:hypothetical protein